jgi:hypothetical protein
MPLKVIFLCGPPRAGKSMLARILAGDVLPRPPHYIRLYPSPPVGTPSLRLADESDLAGMASVQRSEYTPDRVFEILPEVLGKVRRQKRFATVLIEADADPCLRHAFPYDHRIFVMSAPDEVYRVFRRPAEASASLKEVMEDTSAFASEIFGLFEDASWGDEEGVRHRKRVRTEEGVEEQLEVSEQQVRRFLGSPLGAEIASRIQLQPEYHAMVESDIVLVNTALGPCSASVDECVRRIETLMGRIRSQTQRDSVLYCCDPLSEDDPRRAHLLQRLREMLADDA